MQDVYLVRSSNKGNRILETYFDETLALKKVIELSTDHHVRSYIEKRQIKDGKINLRELERMAVLEGKSGCISKNGPKYSSGPCATTETTDTTTTSRS